MHAIIPARNEAPTIGAVVRAVVAAGVCRSVTVVSDGSTDDTASIAYAAGARVLVFHKSQGKGGAMQAGVRALPADREPVFFCDADLLGLEPAHVELLCCEHHRLGADQTIGLRQKTSFLNAVQLVMPLISGERIVERHVLEALPLDCWSGYAIETGINGTVDRMGGCTVLVPMNGVDIRDKTSKVGLLDGLRGHSRMLNQMKRTREALQATDGANCQLRDT